MHVVGFVIRIYYDALSPERQILQYTFAQLCALNFQELSFAIYSILSNLNPGQDTGAPGG